MEAENVYQRGKIYKIVDNTNGNIYIGSTCEKSLARRLASHKSSYQQYIKGNQKHKTSSFDILSNGDYDIVLIENYPCNSKDELHSRERHFQETLECINKCKAGLLNHLGKDEYYKQYNEANKENHKNYYENHREQKLKQFKEYREKNKEQIQEYQKEHYNTNKEVILEKQKIYAQNNKDKTLTYKQKYRESHREQINEKAKSKITCECGCEMRNDSKSKHIKSQKHLDYLKSLE